MRILYNIIGAKSVLFCFTSQRFPAYENVVNIRSFGAISLPYTFYIAEQLLEVRNIENYNEYECGLVVHECSLVQNTRISVSGGTHNYHKKLRIYVAQYRLLFIH